MDGLASPVLAHPGLDLTLPARVPKARPPVWAGRRFWKMSGSGNDFVFIDARAEPAGALATPELIARLCERATGIGADGLVQIRPSAVATLGIDYWNRDGSLASLCGNATLCATRLAVLLQAAESGPIGFTIETGAGVVTARMVEGTPEFDLAPVTDVRSAFEAPLVAGESRIGFALAGVPHVVALVEGSGGADGVALRERGPGLRNHRLLAHGANVNWVGRRGPDRWAMRTYERGVEGETLACGTGAVATAILLKLWGLAGDEVPLETRSGRIVTVRLRREAGGAWRPTLRGEGRMVFEGTFADV